MGSPKKKMEVGRDEKCQAISLNLQLIKSAAEEARSPKGLARGTFGRRHADTCRSAHIGPSKSRG